MKDSNPTESFGKWLLITVVVLFFTGTGIWFAFFRKKEDKDKSKDKDKIQGGTKKKEPGTTKPVKEDCEEKLGAGVLLT